MRAAVGSFLVLVGVLNGLAHAAEGQEEATAVVDRAIALIGGQTQVGKLRAGVWKTSGTFQGRPSRAEFHGELPGKFRIDSTRIEDGKEVHHARIVNGERGWVVEGNKVTPMSKAQIEGVRASFYHKQVATTLLPLKDRDCRLSLAGSTEVEGKPAAVVRVQRKGHPPLTLYFDQLTGLLVKTEMMAADPGTGKDRKVELYLGDYRDFEGIKLATRTRTLHNGKPFLETELVDFRRVDRLPAKLFQAP